MHAFNSPYGTNSKSHIARSNSTSELFNLTADMNTTSYHHMPKKHHHYRTPSYQSNTNYINNADFSISNDHAYKKKLTPYQVQRVKMQKSFMFPNGENFTPKIHHSKKRTQSLRSFTRHGNISSNSINSIQTYNDSYQRKNVSNLSLHARANMTDINNPSKAQSPVNSKKSSSDSDNSMKDENQSIITLPTTESDSQEITKPVYLEHSTHSVIANQLSAKNKIVATPIKKLSMKRPKTASSESLPSKSEMPAPIEKSKKTSGGFKLGSLFKKLFGGSSSHKKRKLNDEKVIVPPSTKIEEPEPVIKMDDIPFSLDPVISEDNNDDLMDTDLIFDSILLKVNNGKASSPTRKLTNMEKKAPLIQKSSENSIEEPYQDANFIDHNLVNDFAKLGDFINLSINDDTNQPPPRSTKRPTLESKRTASEFYNTQSNIIKRLQTEFGVVLIGERPTCNAYISENQISILKPTNTAANTKSSRKTVQFTEQVYLTNTYSVTDYERKDILFKKRMAMLMQGDRQFFDSVKKELNHYKRHEMPVHQDMRSYTQFFD
ncbi:hypothetical protein C6P45_003868 [Maudiozyma exigua]|uniref:Uncharacterized protein n=1 Tax=Maudiozyma exigua TaxID=34358 RepID=A0A9P7BA72_MAUEX|nr:hypothetical protein C6P45_003868 [Kazachstania exigua]